MGTTRNRNYQIKVIVLYLESMLSFGVNVERIGASAVYA